LVAERHQIDGLLQLAELNHLVEDAPMRVVKKIFRLELFNRVIQRVVIQQDGAEHAALGIEVLR